MFDEQPRLVTDYLDRAVKICPSKTAFEDDRRCISYEELQNESYKIADRLIESEIRNKVIAVYISRNINCISSFLGINYSGNTYVILDNHSSEARNKRILERIQVSCIITDRENLKDAKLSFPETKIYCFEDMTSGGFSSETVSNINSMTLGTDPCQITFTSGSTGYPKGATITHVSIINFIENISRIYDFNKDSIFGSHFPFHTISMLLDVYGTLRNMAKNCLFEDALFKKPYELAVFLSEKKVNTLYWSTSAVKLMAYYNFFTAADLSNIRTVIFGGEVIHPFEINKWIENIPGVLMSNVYGATEMTDLVTYKNMYKKISDNEVVPIGKPINNTRIILLENGHESEQGELCVEGICLSKGYYNDPEATNKAFLPKPGCNGYQNIIYHSGDYAKWNENNELIYLGRKDNMVNRHSQRIELGEIEGVTYELELIEEAACVFVKDTEKIYLFYSGKINESDVSDHLRKNLPANMLPDSICRMEEMPHTLSTKIDKESLKKLISNKGEANGR